MAFEFGLTAGSRFRIACRKGDLLEVERYLSDASFDPNASSDDDNGLMMAAAKGRDDVVRRLLADGRVKVNMADGDGNTPFALACAQGHTSVVVLFLRDGRTPFNRQNFLGRTAFWLACYRDRTSTIQLLLKFPDKVDFNTKSLTGTVPSEAGNDATKRLVEDTLRGLLRAGAVATGVLPPPRGPLVADPVSPISPVFQRSNAPTSTSSNSSSVTVTPDNEFETLSRLGDRLVSRRSGKESFASRTIAVTNNSQWAAPSEEDTLTALGASLQAAKLGRQSQFPFSNGNVRTRLPMAASKSKEGSDNNFAKFRVLVVDVRCSSEDCREKPCSVDCYKNKTLGNGGFGVVYEGRLRKHQRVAVKMLKTNDDKTRESFRKEIAVWDGLAQRNSMCSVTPAWASDCLGLRLLFG